MESSIGRLMFLSGIAIIIIGAILALIIGFRFYIIPPEVGVTGIVYDEGELHPQRWWFAFGVFLSTTISGLILMGISGIIQAIEVGKLELKQVKEESVGDSDPDCNPALDR
jgi:uncharacterized membrane protein YuzA (DUF378 family)